MGSAVEKRLSEQGLSVPPVGAPAGAYTGYVQTGALVFVSGQVSRDGSGGLIAGKLGEDIDVEAGHKAAQSCALQLLAQVKEACGGDLDRVVRVVKLNGFVNAAPSFGKHPLVINGASELMQLAFGDAGVHARSAVGCGSLPFNVAVEVEGIFEIR